MAEFAEVLLNLPVNRAFTYRIPDALKDRVKPGVRVQVPFRNLREYGYVAKLTEQANFPRIRDILHADEEVTAGEATLELARWVAERYGCSWGEAVAAAIPAGVKKTSPGKLVRLISAGEGDGRTPKQKIAVAFARSLPTPLPVRDFTRSAGVSTAVVDGLLKSGTLKEMKVRPEIDAMADAIVEKPKEIRLSAAQEEALAEVEKGGTILLHGVTGSGKTEVYLRSIQRAVQEGKQSIVLVPEIALTPQTVSRFKARFPRIAVLHSVLTEADRAAQWRSIRDGKVDVVVGARSAVFAPTRTLGLIVLDEEHEAAYKQDSVPRYHAREVAEERARREGATVILGSATPSLETIARSRDTSIRRARLAGRIGGREMPEIEVVDMTAEKAELKRQPIISRRLEQELRRTLENREQAILFLNRRGYLTHISCPRCRWFFSCTRCDVAMTFHKQSQAAVCHYCLSTQPAPGTCPDCGSTKLLQYGIGTERIESEVGRLFPGYKITRMDSDSMKTRKDYASSLGAFWGGKTDILVGTQMIAKGLDVPDVTLVGVVSADTAFHIPDFRAAERTFQLITQVAGRTGRGPKGGRVVVQTLYPQHYAVKMATTYDTTGFINKELEMRKELSYPPYVTLIRVVVQGFNGDRVKTTADRVAARLRSSVPAPAEVLGPAECPLYKLKGRSRRHILIKAPDRKAALKPIRKTIESSPNDRSIQATLDVDPLNLL